MAISIHYFFEIRIASQSSQVRFFAGLLAETESPGISKGMLRMRPSQIESCFN